MQLDRATARALVEAGYMPLNRYVAMFASEAERQTEPVAVLDRAHQRPRPRTVPAHFAALGGRRTPSRHKKKASAA